MAKLGSLKSHIFLCVSDKPVAKACATRQVQESAWDHLKTRLRELNLSSASGRTQANCLRICKDGPVAVVMDWRGATWYKNCSNDMLDRIIEEHLVKGIVVTGENLMATNSEIVKKHS